MIQMSFSFLKKYHSSKKESGDIKMTTHKSSTGHEIDYFTGSIRGGSSILNLASFERTIFAYCPFALNKIIILLFSFFVPDFACYLKVWVRDFYCPKMSL